MVDSFAVFAPSRFQEAGFLIFKLHSIEKSFALNVEPISTR
jgi:hypothetical protein